MIILCRYYYVHMLDKNETHEIGTDKVSKKIIYRSVEMKIIKLQSSDGVVFMTDEETVKCSGTITIMLDCFEMETEPFIPLPNVHSSILEPILEWAEYHKKGKLNQSSDEVLQWRYDFMVKYEGEIEIPHSFLHLF